MQNYVKPRAVCKLLDSERIRVGFIVNFYYLGQMIVPIGIGSGFDHL